MNFEWDEKKGAENLRKHRISFDEASTIFVDLSLPHNAALSGKMHA